MVAAGDLGRKTGKGFFEYGAKGEGRKAKNA
jgi:3-hydroxyacyl-CoA dehydrogenase